MSGPLAQALAVCERAGVDPVQLSDNELLLVSGIGRKQLATLRENAPTVVVTRHPALVEHLIEIGLCKPDTPVITHACPADVRGKHVIGVLPLSLAALAARVTEVPLTIPEELRGQELTAEQIWQHACHPRTYTVRLV